MKVKIGILVLALQSLFGAVLTKSLSDTTLELKDTAADRARIRGQTGKEKNSLDDVKVDFKWREDESWEEAIENLLTKVSNAFFAGGQNFTDPVGLSSDQLFLNCFSRAEITTLDIKYVNPMGTCFRMFKNPGCAGHSLPIHAGSKDVPSIQDPKFQSFSSIGPCYEHELDFSRAANILPQGNYIGEDSTNSPETPDRLPGRIDQCAAANFGDPATALDRLPLIVNDCAERPAVSIWFLCNPETVPLCHYPSGWSSAGNDELVGDKSLPPAEQQVLKPILPPNINKEGKSSPAMEGFLFQRKESAQKWENVTHNFVNSMVARKLRNALLIVYFDYADEKATQPFGLDYTLSELSGKDSEFMVDWSTGGFIRN